MDTDYESPCGRGRPVVRGGSYGLKMEFGVATDLGQDAYQGTIAPTVSATELTITHDVRIISFLTSREGQNDAGYRFPHCLDTKTLRMSPQQRPTPQGRSFHRRWLDCNGHRIAGFGNNFQLRAPVSAGDYIVEVKGASASTQGAYLLETLTSEAWLTDRGTAPNMLDSYSTVGDT